MISGHPVTRVAFFIRHVGKTKIHTASTACLDLVFRSGKRHFFALPLCTSQPAFFQYDRPDVCLWFQDGSVYGMLPGGTSVLGCVGLGVCAILSKSSSL